VIRELRAVGRAVLAGFVQLNRYAPGTQPGRKSIAELADYENGDRNLGLFQGRFDKNILTFNSGWTSDAQPHFDLELVFPMKKMKGA
jgi:hypothetical protein